MDIKLEQSAYFLRKNIFKVYQILYQAIKIDRRIDLFIRKDHRGTGCLIFSGIIHAIYKFIFF